MSSSIRPPGAPPTGPGALDSLGDVKESATGGTAGKAAQATQEAQAAGASQVAESPTASWLKRLEAGEVTKSQAIDGLVAEAVEAHGGARLNAAQRAELSSILREALLGDPVLGELLGG